ncbi:unnamed protein product [Parnassius apollo]|uniref:(apollo) hypothetical protein n=1 Tax=Parnassius apollo TaxID=110799 RepID=A0A8S3WP60_PARAO|nr:unnamed protein product [Parnassius apollo]
MESNAYDYGGGSGNVSEEEAASERRKPKFVIEISTPAPFSLEAETIIPEKSSQDEESTLPPEILADLGLTKEQKENLLTKTLIIENFQPAIAPRLLVEIVSVINESTKNHDRREKMQNQLGCGIAGLAHLTSDLKSKEISK